MHSTTFRNVNEALPYLLNAALAQPKETSRVGEARELLAQTVTLTHPWERFVTIRHRSANPFAQLAETLWVLSGRNDITWLSYYLPRAKDFSDDGETWRAGYGPRLRRWPLDRRGRHTLDQVSCLVDALANEPNTRRAVLALWDPARDWVTTKDAPCNNWIQFVVRDSRLHMHVTVRSNDLMWGWSGINTFEWSFLQEVVATSLGIACGPATYFVGSMHLYEYHADRARKIVQSSIPFAEWDESDCSLDLALGDLDDWLNTRFFAQENSLRSSPDALKHLIGRRTPYTVEADALRMLDIYARTTQRDLSLPEIYARTDHIVRPDMQEAALEWLHRMEPKATSGPTVAASLATIAPTAATPADVAVSATEEDTAAPQPTTTFTREAFMEAITRLQAGKARTYGDSWRKYGEKGSIFPNIARKFDRLENLWKGSSAPVGDETFLDTVIDLGVYAALYYGWLLWDVDATFADALDDLVDDMVAYAVEDENTIWRYISASFHRIAVELGMEGSTPSALIDGRSFDRIEDAVSTLATAAFALAENLMTEESWQAFQATVAKFDAVAATA